MSAELGASGGAGRHGRVEREPAGVGVRRIAPGVLVVTGTEGEPGGLPQGGELDPNDDLLTGPPRQSLLLDGQGGQVAWQGSSRRPRWSGSPGRGGGRQTCPAPAQVGGVHRTRLLVAAAGALAVALTVLVAGSVGSSGAAGAAPPVIGGPAVARAPSGADPTEDPALGPESAGNAGGSERAAPSAVPELVPPAGASNPVVQGGSGSASAQQVSPGSSGRAGGAVLASSDPQWIDVLTRLDSARAKALAKGERELLALAVAADSPAWKADLALLRSLRASGLRPSRLRTTVVAAVPLGPGEPGLEVTARPSESAGRRSAAATPGVVDRGAAVTLLVTDRRAGYELVDAQGAVVHRVAQAPKARWRVELVASATDIGWLVSDVRAVP